MKRKGLFKVVVIAMLIAQMAAFVQPVSADGGRDVMALDPPLVEITHSSFNVYDSVGTEVTDYTNIPQDASISIGYSFSVMDAALPADDVVGGDFFTITLPSALTDIASFDSVVNSPLTILWEGTTYTIGYLNITAAGEATVTFNTDIAALSGVTTNITITGDFLADNIGDNTASSFQLSAGGQIYTIGFENDPVVVPPPEATIAKTGSYDSATNTITWTVTVDSGAPDVTVAGVSVVDALDANQTYDSSSLDAENVSTDLDGNTVFALGDVTGVTSFSVVTTPTDSAFGAEASSKTLSNDVSLYATGFTDPIDTAHGTVTVTTDWIKKSGVARTTGGVHYIDWTITLNNNNRTIPSGATVTDTIPTYLSLDTDTVLRNGADITTFGDTVGLVGQDFTYTFGSAASGVQVITFTTTVTESYYEQQSTTGFRNTAVLHISPDSYSVQSGNVGVSTSLLAKSGQGYNAATQLITWRLEVNRNGQAFTGATIVDSIQTNEEFYGTYTLTRLDGSVTTTMTQVFTLDEVDDSANQYYFNNSAKTLTIYLGNISESDHPYITLKTQVTNPALYAANGTSTCYNSATLTGVGIQPCTVTNASQSVPSLVIAKTSTGYNYTTRVLSWTITVNQNNMDMPNAVITDVIPAGQGYVADSMLIGGADPGEMLDVTGNTLTVTLGAISAQTVITFQTEVTNLDVFLETNSNVTFQNSATLNSGIVGAPTPTVGASRVVTNKAVEKSLGIEYTPASGFIGWEVYVNANQAPMFDAVLSDTLQSGLELDNESVALYYWNQDAAGVRTVGGAVPESDYSFTYDYATRIFEVSLPDGAQGYYLTFNTDVLSAGSYSNTISFSGSYSGNDGAQSAYIITDSNVTTSSSGYNGSITVTKVDDDTGAPIEGAVFELLDNMKNVKTTATTDENGQITFTRLKIRTYYVREKTAPLGYALNDGEIQVTLAEGSAETLNPTITVEDTALRASVSMQKLNTVDKGLSGGLFGIYYAADTTIAVQTASAADGLVIFTDLLPGDYVILELKAPSGYYKTTQAVTVSLVLDEDNNTLDDVLASEAMLDKSIPPDFKTPTGNITMYKTDTQGVSLSGGLFGIYDAEDVSFSTALETAASENGQVVFADLPGGDYVIRELQAPAGYALSDTAVAVTLVKSGITVADVTILEPFVNAPVIGSVSLLKVTGGGQPLAGALFGLYDEGGALLKSALSGEDGTVLFTEVPYGDYTVKEISAPSGYSLSNQVMTVSVMTNGVNLANPFTVVNVTVGSPGSGTDTDPGVEIGPDGLPLGTAEGDIDENGVPTGTAGTNDLPKTGGTVEGLAFAAIGLALVISGGLLVLAPTPGKRKR